MAERLAAIDAVHALCDALDSRDAAAVGALFTETGAFAPFGPPLIGPAAISAAMAHLANAPDQRHLVTNVRVARTGDEVVVDAVFSVFHFTGGPLQPTIVLQTSTTCVRHDDRMMITHHSGRPLSPMPPMPGGPPPS
jgi:uncharacterized protein (TIGR02246 family)